MEACYSASVPAKMHDLYGEITSRRSRDVPYLHAQRLRLCATNWGVGGCSHSAVYAGTAMYRSLTLRQAYGNTAFGMTTTRRPVIPSGVEGSVRFDCRLHPDQLWFGELLTQRNVCWNRNVQIPNASPGLRQHCVRDDDDAPFCHPERSRGICAFRLPHTSRSIVVWRVVRAAQCPQESQCTDP